MDYCIVIQTLNKTETGVYQSSMCVYAYKWNLTEANAWRFASRWMGNDTPWLRAWDQTLRGDHTTERSWAHIWHILQITSTVNDRHWQYVGVYSVLL